MKVEFCCQGQDCYIIAQKIAMHFGYKWQGGREDVSERFSRYLYFDTILLTISRSVYSIRDPNCTYEKTDNLHTLAQILIAQKAAFKISNNTISIHDDYIAIEEVLLSRSEFYQLQEAVRRRWEV